MPSSDGKDDAEASVGVTDSSGVATYHDEVRQQGLELDPLVAALYDPELYLPALVDEFHLVVVGHAEVAWICLITSCPESP